MTVDHCEIVTAEQAPCAHLLSPGATQPSRLGCPNRFGVTGADGSALPLCTPKRGNTGPPGSAGSPTLLLSASKAVGMLTWKPY